MLLAVLTLDERFTVLQAIGTALMLGGSFITQRKSGGSQAPTSNVAQATRPERAFQPRVFSGYLFALGAAMSYGSSPLMARQAFLYAPGASTAAGGCLAYAAATLVFSLVLLKPGSWSDIRNTSRENLPWFLASAVLVAISQAFVYASLSVAPLMVVTPILQLSLVFRLFLSQWINREHEVMNTAIMIGAFTAVLGSVLVSVDTEELTKLLSLPPSLADILRYRIAGV
jgi:drug/metabolite transporter (DMT)-like permease